MAKYAVKSLKEIIMGKKECCQDKTESIGNIAHFTLGLMFGWATFAKNKIEIPPIITAKIPIPEKNLQIPISNEKPVDMGPIKPYFPPPAWNATLEAMDGTLAYIRSNGLYYVMGAGSWFLIQNRTWLLNLTINQARNVLANLRQNRFFDRVFNGNLIRERVPENIRRTLANAAEKMEDFLKKKILGIQEKAKDVKKTLKKKWGKTFFFSDTGIIPERTKIEIEEKNPIIEREINLPEINSRILLYDNMKTTLKFLIENIDINENIIQNIKEKSIKYMIEVNKLENAKTKNIFKKLLSEINKLINIREKKIKIEEKEIDFEEKGKEEKEIKIIVENPEKLIKVLKENTLPPEEEEEIIERPNIIMEIIDMSLNETEVSIEIPDTFIQEVENIFGARIVLQIKNIKKNQLAKYKELKENKNKVVPELIGYLSDFIKDYNKIKSEKNKISLKKKPALKIIITLIKNIILNLISKEEFKKLNERNYNLMEDFERDIGFESNVSFINFYNTLSNAIWGSDKIPESQTFDSKFIYLIVFYSHKFK